MAVPDRGLDVLLDQINEAAPGRSKSSDGWIGDPDHQSRDSDHNPETIPGNPPDQVDARDFTHDPAHGADMAVISEELRLSRDKRILYVIFNRRIFSSYAVGGVPAWTWRPYSGTNPHDKHMHVSVVDFPHDVTTPWSIGVDMTPAQAYVQHVMNNRIDALIGNKPVVTVPPFSIGGQSWPQIVQTNQMYLALQRADDEFDTAALAQAIVDQIGDISLPGTISEAQVREVVQAVLNRTHLVVEGEVVEATPALAAGTPAA